MGKAKLEVLGLEVPTGLLTVYHDDGFVDSIEEHTLKLIDEYGFQITQDYTKFFPAIGRQLVLPGFLRVHCHIFYLKDLSPEVTIAVRAHEETHALEVLGHLDILAEKILKEQRVKIDFRGVDDRKRDWREIVRRTDNGEVKADIGSVYALHDHGIDPNHIFINVAFEIARDLYEQARLQGE